MRRVHWTRSTRAAAAMIAAIVAGSSCTENLPSGPNTFTGVTLSIVVLHDTILVGDQSTAQARATDANGHVIQNLGFAWATSDGTILGLTQPAGSADSAG